MVNFMNNGLSISYPGYLLMDGSFSREVPSVILMHPQTRNTLTLALVKSPNFESLYETKCNPDVLERSSLELIRAGSYRFPGSKELFVKDTAVEAVALYCWCVLVPLESGTIVIMISSTIEDEINSIWAPIMESIEIEALSSKRPVV